MSSHVTTTKHDLCFPRNIQALIVFLFEISTRCIKCDHRLYSRQKGYSDHHLESRPELADSESVEHPCRPSNDHNRHQRHQTPDYVFKENNYLSRALPLRCPRCLGGIAQLQHDGHLEQRRYRKTYAGVILGRRKLYSCKGAGAWICRGA